MTRTAFLYKDYDYAEGGGYEGSFDFPPIHEIWSDGYSIFKVLRRNRPRETFEEAEWRVRKHVKRRKTQRAFNEYLEGLRREYASQVKIREDNLKVHFGAG